MQLYYEAAADRSAGTREQQRGAYHTAFLGDEGVGDKSVLFGVMADGVEGHPGGQVASIQVISTFRYTVGRRIGRSTFPALLRESMGAANTALGAAKLETPELGGMACTVVAVLLVGGRLHWASVGDSRLYLIRDGELRRLNADHSYGAFLEQARASGVDATPERGLTPDMLMSAVTGEPIGDIDCPNQGIDLREGDRLILAGRRLLESFDEAILAASREHEQTGAALTALKRAVEGATGEQQEGTTVIVIDVLDRDAEKASAATPDAAAVGPARAETRAAEAARPSVLLDVLAGLSALAIFLVAAAGTWYGLGELNAWREATRANPDRPPGIAVVAPALPGESAGAGSGRNLAAPPAAGQGGGLTFGSPVPLAIGGPSEAPPGPEAAPVAGGFRDALADGSEGPLMVRVAAGSFQMGSASQSAEPESMPRRKVTVSGFAMSSYEVTVAQYASFARATGRAMPDVQGLDPETTPVSRVTWDDAYAYTLWLSRQTGQRYRLPSEAEWEYAARGGTSTPFWWGNQVGKDRAHCSDCDTGLNPRRASRVGRFSPNPFGLHDTAGNLAEWVHDCWHPDYRGAPTDGGVWEGGDCESRVVRGGGFNATSRSIRSSRRESVPARRALDTVGFRVARDLEDG